LNGFALCLVALKGEADRWEAYLKTLKDSKTQSPAYVVRDTESFEIRITASVGPMTGLYYYKCLPATVKPEGN